MLPSALKYISHLFTSLVLGLSLTHSSPVSAKKCPKLANLIEDISQPQSDLLRYAEQGKLPDSQEHLRSFFKIAEKKYMKRFGNDEKIKDFKKILQVIAAKGKVSTSELAELVENRILAQGVRSNYTMFSADHAPPKDFHKFVRDFGKLKDSLTQKEAAEARELAVKLLKHVEKGYHNPKNFGFRPAPAGSITNYSSEALDRMEALITKKMDLHTYHDVRKEIRNFKVIYKTINKEVPSPIYRGMAEKAGKISGQMGEIKEELFLDKAHLDRMVTIDESIQADIRGFIKDFRKINSK